MKREEAYQTFKTKEVEPLVNQYLLALEEKFQQNKDKYAKTIIQQFKEALKNLSELQQEKKIEETGYIIATVLRTSFYQKNYTITIKAYNTHLYLDKTHVDIGECDISPIMECYDKLYDILQKERKKYVGKLCATDIRNLLNPCLKGCIDYSFKLCKYAIPEIVKTEEFAKVQKAEKFYIFGEEYMDEKIPLYIENKNKNIDDIKENIQEKDEYEIIATDYSNLDLSSIDFSGQNLSYSNFNNSILNNVNFNKSILIGCTFNNTKINNANFESAYIIESTFNKSEITNTTFTNAIGYSGGISKEKWESAGNLPVDFSESKMKRVDFREANIKGASFTNTKQEAVIFGII